MPELLSTHEARKRLPLGRTKFEDLIRSGVIEVVRIGAARFIVGESIDTFIEANRSNGGDES